MEYFNLLSLILILVGICLALFGLMIKRFNNWYYVSRRLGYHGKQHHLPPGHLGWLLIGNMYAFYKSLKSPAGPDSFIHGLTERYGRTGVYKTHMFGKPSVVVTQPETCKKVLSMDDTNFRLGYPIVTRLSDKSINSLEGAEHRRLRRAMAGPLSGHEVLASYVGLIENTVIASLDEWASMSMNDKPIELLTELKHSTFKIITTIFLGPNIGLNIVGPLEKLCYVISEGLISIPINFPGFAFRRSAKALEKMVKILEVVVKERRIELGKRNDQSAHEGKCLLDLLLMKDNDDERLDDEEIVFLITTLLFAGHETSAHATMWAISYLHDHPTLLQILKEEQAKIMRNRPSTQKGLTFKEIREMDFLAKVIQETFRLANIVLTLLRVAKKDVNINGYTIPKGWQVMIMPRAVHMDPEIYPNPRQYDPLRWDNYNAKAGAFLPFGLGSRFCPGADLARLQVTIFLHCFVLGYRIERINPGCPMNYVPMPRPKDNYLAKVMKL